MVLKSGGVHFKEVSQMNSRWNILKPFEDKNEYMNDRIATGIEAHRKGFAFVKVVDEKGDPVRDARIRVIQKSHDFKYGANLFMLDEIPDSPEKNILYRKYFAEAFNTATIPFYWDTLEPEQGKPRYGKDSPRIYRRPAPDLCLEFCEENAIEPKAHCLNYAAFMPSWAKGSLQWEKQCLEKRFRELSERYAKRIPTWEVTNESYWGSRNLSSLYMQDDFVEWSFALAENCFPSNHLMINESGARIWDWTWFHFNRSAYYMQIERALHNGARIDSIGMQYHMFFRREDEAKESAVYYDPEQLYAVMDTYAKLGRPLQITELTIPAYSDSPEDEQIQAQIIENIYSIFFSHPAMDVIIYWNVPSGYAHGTVPGDMTSGENYYYGGLLRFDMTPRKAYNVIRDLFGKKWRTVLELHTDPSGSFSFKGFYGKYDLEITSGSGKICRTLHLRNDLKKHFTITL